MKKKKRAMVTPLGQLLLDFSEENEISLTEISLRAGLSSGSVRSLINFPERKPTIETCLRLATVINKPADDILQMAGLGGLNASENLHPDRVALLKVFDSLPIPMRRSLVNVAEAIASLTKTE